MRKLLILLTIGVWMTLPVAGQYHLVPRTLTYCGVELNLTEEARRIIGGYVAKIYESPRHFNQMVQRADTYMPFIEEALRDERVPQDLKYLVIQESALLPNAVSSSNAVGFWQFKAPTAREMGLMVNEYVDERKHIYRASRAAARLLAKGNMDFDNWVYAVIAFYEGLTGAVSYTNPAYYNARRMVIDENFHWYALKAIAHKVAYEEAIGMKNTPELWLMPYATEGVTNLRRLYEKHDLTEDEFFAYNHWVVDRQRLPKHNNFSYYVPRKGSFYPGHREDPVKETTSPDMIASRPVRFGAEPEGPLPNVINEVTMVAEDVYAEESEAVKPPVTATPAAHAASGLPSAPKALPADRLAEGNYADFPIRNDLNYGIDYVVYDGSEPLPAIALRYGLEPSKLLSWNYIQPANIPASPAIIYLKPPKKVAFHIVQEGEDLAGIALRHLTSMKRIQSKNRMNKQDAKIYVGQKLYLKKKKPRDEKRIILIYGKEEQPAPDSLVTVADTVPAAPVLPVPYEPAANAEATTGVAEPPASPDGANMGGSSMEEDVQDVQTRWVTHIVKSGDTLWKISQQYGTKVEIIKMINKLESDKLSEGQPLRILARVAVRGMDDAQIEQAAGKQKEER